MRPKATAESFGRLLYVEGKADRTLVLYGTVGDLLLRLAEFLQIRGGFLAHTSGP